MHPLHHTRNHNFTNPESRFIMSLQYVETIYTHTKSVISVYCHKIENIKNIYYAKLDISFFFTIACVAEVCWSFGSLFKFSTWVFRLTGDGVKQCKLRKCYSLFNPYMLSLFVQSIYTMNPLFYYYFLNTVRQVLHVIVSRTLLDTLNRMKTYLTMLTLKV